MATVEKGKMYPQEEKSVQTYLSDLEALVEASDLTPRLFSEFIISRDDKEKIEAGGTRKERTKRLLDIIVWRGLRSFSVLVHALEANGYKDLALKLYRCSVQTKEGRSSEEENVSEVFDCLSQRIRVMENDIKKTLVTKAEHGSISVELKSLSLKMQGLSSTLQKIEDLSTASKETELTITNLRHQVEEKDKLLQCARERIDELENKLENLEAENAYLRSDMKRQNMQIRALRREVEDERLRGERIQKQAAEEKRRTEEKFQKHEKMLEMMLKDQLEEKEKIQNLEKKLEGNGRQKRNTVKKPIIPRNRMQDYRK